MKYTFNDFFNKINNFINKIGKINFVLLVIVLMAFVIVGLYTTYATDSTDNYSITGDTYKFILGDNTDTTVTIAAQESKYLDVTVKNSESIELQYALYYSSTISNIEIGYISSTEYPTSGKISSNTEIIISILIINNSTSDADITLGVDYGTVKGGEIAESGTRIEDELYLPTIASKYITKLYSSATKTSVTTAGDEKITQATDVNLMEDSAGNIRYYGASPNNYVSFNDELWRIIGVFEVEDENGDTESRVKIVRDESIGTFAYDNKTSGIGTATDDNGSNDWTDARLMMLLNPGYENGATDDSGNSIYGYAGSLYWNSGSGTCYSGSSDATVDCDFTSTGLGDTAKSLIGQAKYYLGGSSTYTDLYANDYYTYERGTTVYSGHATEWTGYIGLIYPSDYAYATDLSVCTQNTYSYETDATNCTGTDWLYKNINTWTITPYSSGTNYVFRIGSAGIISYNNNYYATAVYPTAYLNSDVKISGGDGTSSEPYTLE